MHTGRVCINKSHSLTSTETSQNTRPLSVTNYVTINLPSVTHSYSRENVTDFCTSKGYIIICVKGYEISEKRSVVTTTETFLETGHSR